MLHAREALIEALVQERQAFVVEAHEVKNGRVEVTCVAALFDRLEADLVGRADRLASHLTGDVAGRELR